MIAYVLRLEVTLYNNFEMISHSVAYWQLLVQVYIFAYHINAFANCRGIATLPSCKNTKAKTLCFSANNAKGRSLKQQRLLMLPSLII